LMRVAGRALERRMQQLDVLARRLVHPGERVANQRIHLNHLANRLRGSWAYAADGWRWQLREVYRRLSAQRPDIALRAVEQRALARRLAGAARAHVGARQAAVKSLAAQLAHLNPQAVLERGYSITESADGAIVRDSARIQRDQQLKVTFARGWARARVVDKK
ncbi:MAG TPA: exodeoxyribonuclease VII large subunit, partial [Burkholderiales bacterium]|nr:exodeoxyribonuclease VII large subunit [Burkholderiales bacterium]